MITEFDEPSNSSVNEVAVNELILTDIRSQEHSFILSLS
jgi:hypothetical protein